ncbi:uncharacterized protein LOC144580692 [Callithrix jacchus]
MGTNSIWQEATDTWELCTAVASGLVLWADCVQLTLRTEPSYFPISGAADGKSEAAAAPASFEAGLEELVSQPEDSLPCTHPWWQSPTRGLMSPLSPLMAFPTGHHSLFQLRTSL